MTAPARFRSRLVAGLLALFAGFSGAHRAYLGARWWPIYPLIAMPAIGFALRAEPWYRHPGFFVAALVVVAAMLEAIGFSLVSDERWDARYNAGVARRSRGGWSNVFVAIAALLLGTVLLLSVLAIALETWFRPPLP
ncbi:MAG: TM2 domain-containing protein [Burkholderiaceae bacterium]|nr:TM2 domain-containing protein [Burkholderiaceae bacterium]